MEETVPILSDINILVPKVIENWSWSLSMILLGINVILAWQNRSTLWLLNIAILFVTSWVPLPIAFGFYFVILHSYSAWEHLNAYIVEQKSLWRQTIPFTLGAYITFILMLYFFQDKFDIYQGALVIFVASISFPHILCMNHFYKKISAT
jgi:hypothetical protein